MVHSPCEIRDWFLLIGLGKSKIVSSLTSGLSLFQKSPLINFPIFSKSNTTPTCTHHFCHSLYSNHTCGTICADIYIQIQEDLKQTDRSLYADRLQISFLNRFNLYISVQPANRNFSDILGDILCTDMFLPLGESHWKWIGWNCFYNRSPWNKLNKTRHKTLTNPLSADWIDVTEFGSHGPTVSRRKVSFFAGGNGLIFNISHW